MQMQSKRLLILALLLLFMGAACNDSDKYKRAAVAVSDFTIALQTFQSAEIAAHNTGFVDNETHVKIQGSVAKAAEASLVMTKAIKDAKSTPTAIGGIQTALDTTRTLLDQDLLGVKNQQTKAQLIAIALALRAPLLVLSSLFGGVQ